MSGRAPYLRPVKAIDAGDMSTASLTSKVYRLEDLFHAMAQFIWTTAGNDAVGTFDVQGCFDATVDASGQYVSGSGTWNSLPGIAAKLQHPASAPGSFLLDLDETAVPFIRFTYTRTTGSGTLTVWFCAKG